jgi:two-component system alkaline phosphatase synthesis response regulator PhoP
LTPLEFRLLVFLARNGGKLLTFNQILAHAWGGEYNGNVEYVHIYISRLRKKIELNSKNPLYILSVHGIGYIFEKPDLEYMI